MAWSTACCQYACVPFAGSSRERTSGLVQMGQIGQVVAGLEHGRVHQRGQVRVIAGLDGRQRRHDGFFLASSVSLLFHGHSCTAHLLLGLAAYLAILELEDQLHLVALDLLVDDLGGDPAVGGVWLPCPGAVLVDVCHVGGRVPLPLVDRGEPNVRVQRVPSVDATAAPAR